MYSNFKIKIEIHEIFDNLLWIMKVDLTALLDDDDEEAGL